MSIRGTIEVNTKLAQHGVVERYAIAGAVAALNYIDPTLTEDLDILISTSHFENHPSGLLLLGPIEKALAAMGYGERTDIGYMIEGWPVQFLPVSCPLEEDALEQAIEIDIDDAGASSVKARCLRAEHLIAIALKVGCLKDLARIEAFLTQGSVDLVALERVLEKHDLMGLWRQFCIKAGIKDPLAIK